MTNKVNIVKLSKEIYLQIANFLFIHVFNDDYQFNIFNLT